MGVLAEDFYESQGFYADQDESGDLETFCNAWMVGLEQVYERFRDREDGRPGFAIVFDPDEADAEDLPYLSQWVGARLQPAWTEAQKREEIKAPTTWRRGQPETYKTAIQATLTGSRRVIIRQRTPEPWDLYVRTLKEETPDEALTEEVARVNKVAGLVLDYEAIDGVTWADIAAAYEDWDEVESTFTDWADLADILPDELPE